MNASNPVSAKTIQINNQFIHCPVLARPTSLLSFRTSPPPQPPPLLSSYFPIKASSFSSKPKTPKTQNPEDKPLIPFSLFQFSSLKPTLIATVTATALVFSRFCFNPKPAISALLSPPPTVEKNVDDSVAEEEGDKSIDEYLLSNPNDVDALMKLMEVRIKNKKILDAIKIIDKLIELEPNETDWHFLKSHLYIYSGELELAKVGFNEILAKDPFRVEAYHGLIMAASKKDSMEEWEEIEEKVEEGIKLCEKENKESDLREFKLLLAQIQVIVGEYDDALDVYDELVEKEPWDFRPYLCQGIVYTLLKKEDKAEKCLEKYRKLVPEGHPHASYYNDNLIATKGFADEVANKRLGSKS